MIANEIEVRNCKLEAVNTFPKKLDRRDCPDFVSAMQMEHLVKRKGYGWIDTQKRLDETMDPCKLNLIAQKILLMENKTN